MGNDCRIWVRVAGSDGSILNVCTVALPTMGIAKDEKWGNELHGLDSDIRSLLLDQGRTHLTKVVLMGDFNFQPASLGGMDPSPRRRQAWQCFMLEWG